MKSPSNWRALFIVTGFVLAAMALASASAISTKTAELHNGTNESAAQSSSASLPVGTILPVQLNKTLSLAGAQAGQEIDGEIMQEVPLSRSRENSREVPRQRHDRVRHTGYR